MDEPARWYFFDMMKSVDPSGPPERDVFCWMMFDRDISLGFGSIDPARKKEDAGTIFERPASHAYLSKTALAPTVYHSDMVKPRNTSLLL